MKLETEGGPAWVDVGSVAYVAPEKTPDTPASDLDSSPRNWSYKGDYRVFLKDASGHGAAGMHVSFVLNSIQAERLIEALESRDE